MDFLIIQSLTKDFGANPSPNIDAEEIVWESSWPLFSILAAASNTFFLYKICPANCSSRLDKLSQNRSEYSIYY